MIDTRYELCVCGHVRAHHRPLGILNPTGQTLCEWRGCGCPRFLDPAPTEAPEHPVDRELRREAEFFASVTGHLESL